MLKLEHKSLQFAENNDLVVKYLDKCTKDVIKYLYNSAIVVSCAESCTGGMLAQAITSVPGASAIFELGICSYSNRIKEQILGIDKMILNTYGAISSQTALCMAHSVQRLSSSDIGVAITGCAGPDMSEGKPVGTVYCAAVGFGQEIVYNLALNEFNLCDRRAIRQLSVISCLDDIKNLATMFRTE